MKPHFLHRIFGQQTEHPPQSKEFSVLGFSHTEMLVQALRPSVTDIGAERRTVRMFLTDVDADTFDDKASIDTLRAFVANPRNRLQIMLNRSSLKNPLDSRFSWITSTSHVVEVREQTFSPPVEYSFALMKDAYLWQLAPRFHTLRVDDMVAPESEEGFKRLKEIWATSWIGLVTPIPNIRRDMS